MMTWAAATVILAFLAGPPGKPAAGADDPGGRKALWGIGQEEWLQEVSFRHLVRVGQKKWPTVREYSLDYRVGERVYEASSELVRRVRALGHPVKRGAEERAGKRAYIRLSEPKRKSNLLEVPVRFGDVGDDKREVLNFETTVRLVRKQGHWQVAGIRGQWKLWKQPRK